MNIIMLGAPGAGKGTIAAEIKEKYKVSHASSGDIFRENIRNKTELGVLAKTYIDKGVLVPDDVTINMMLDTLDGESYKTGFILDGFPRTMTQAVEFDKSLSKLNKKIDLVILVEADDEQILERLAGRRVCENCSAIYHIPNMPPKVDGVCDICGGKVIQRKDDNEAVIRERLGIYHKETAPLIDYYKERNILKSISGFVKTKEERLSIIDAMMKGV